MANTGRERGWYRLKDNYVSGLDKIFNVLAETGIIRDSNRNWLIEVVIDSLSGELEHCISCEMPEWDRKVIMAADSYIYYWDESVKVYGILKKGFVKYDFLQKIIDDRNNLIIIASPNPYEITAEYGDLNAEIPEEDIIK